MLSRVKRGTRNIFQSIPISTTLISLQGNWAPRQHHPVFWDPKQDHARVILAFQPITFFHDLYQWVIHIYYCVELRLQIALEQLKENMKSARAFKRTSKRNEEKITSSFLLSTCRTIINFLTSIYQRRLQSQSHSQKSSFILGQVV